MVYFVFDNTLSNNNNKMVLTQKSHSGSEVMYCRNKFSSGCRALNSDFALGMCCITVIN